MSFKLYIDSINNGLVTLHTRLLALKRFPTTDEITKLFIFVISLTARVEKIVCLSTELLDQTQGLSTSDANNSFKPSTKILYMDSWYSQTVEETITEVKFKLIIFIVIQKIGQFHQNLIVLYIFGVSFNLSKVPNFLVCYIDKTLFCFSFYSYNSAFQCLVS